MTSKFANGVQLLYMLFTAHTNRILWLSVMFYYAFNSSQILYLDPTTWALHNHSEMFLTDADSEEVADMLKTFVDNIDAGSETKKNGMSC